MSKRKQLFSRDYFPKEAPLPTFYQQQVPQPTFRQLQVPQPAGPLLPSAPLLPQQQQPLAPASSQLAWSS